MVKRKMSREDIEKELKEIIFDITNIKKEKLTLTTNLRTDIGIDSLDVAEIMFAIKQKFGIELSPEDIETVSTLDSIVKNLEIKINR